MHPDEACPDCGVLHTSWSSHVRHAEAREAMMADAALLMGQLEAALEGVDPWVAAEVLADLIARYDTPPWWGIA